jgi:hypothetical protein
VFSRSSKWANWLALLIAVAAIFVTYFVADRIYERMSHLEDEMAYLWQAQAISSGDLVLPSPPNPKSFMTPFVVDHNGMRFSKYPPGWSIILSVGIRVGLRDWVSPLLSALSIWLLYLLTKRITSPMTGLLAIFLMFTSPMFWMLSGTFLSHIWSLVLTLGFALAWLDIFSRKEHASSSGDLGNVPHKNNLVPFALFVDRPAPRWMLILVAGLSLGVLVLTRPMTAAGVGIPFFLHGLVLLVRGDKSTRIQVLTIGMLAGMVVLLLFAWQFAVTGDLMQNPYTLWWKYDKVGFGSDVGRWKDGYTPDLGWFNIKYSLNKSQGDLLGWGKLWWLFLPFGIWSLRRKVGGWLTAGIFPGLMLAYVLYWIGSWLYGPRYYFEGLITLTVLSAAGISWLAGNGMRIRKILTGLALVVLVGYNLFTYLPDRLWEMHGLYNINRSMLEPFYTVEAQKIQPALIIVHTQKEWTEYGGLLELQNAQLTTPFIFALHRNDAVFSDFYEVFPERKIYHYYLDKPFTFYTLPRNNR